LCSNCQRFQRDVVSMASCICYCSPDATMLKITHPRFYCFESPTSYGIEVSKLSTAPLGQEVTASKGVHHWSYISARLYFFPDEDVDAINTKFKKGYQLEVAYLDTNDCYDIEVSPEATSCWKPGTELLLTSHTRNQDDQQVRTIESSDSATGVIRLTAPIDKPISLQDHADFAVEVASLNRRIVFERTTMKTMNSLEAIS
jgi:hypothetical protein